MEKKLFKSLHEKYGYLNLGYLKASFIDLFSNFKYEKNLLNTVKRVLMSLIIDRLSECIKVNVKKNFLFSCESFCKGYRLLHSETILQ